MWLGQQAIRLLELAAPFTPGGALPQTPTGYRAGETFMAGPFRITPYLMDHSAYDAHALLVEASERRMFYSGDFRGHGRKAQVFERFLANPPANIELLLMEGTTLDREEPAASEADVEAQATAIMQETAGLALTVFSAQNIFDWFVSFLCAAIRSGRTFVIDAYLANLIRGLGLHSLPDPASDERIRVFLPTSQKRMIVASGRFDLIEPFRQRRIFSEEIADNPGRFAMLFRTSMARDLPSLDLAGGSVIYWLWPGYLERDRIDLRQWCRERNIDFHLAHSSGHATLGDLRRMAHAIQPERLMPIHSAVPQSYTGLYPSVQWAGNGDWVDV